ncbi:MAG: DUF5916 domain-containing protein [Vicinamibacterales bacterium]
MLNWFLVLFLLLAPAAVAGAQDLPAGTPESLVALAGVELPDGFDGAPPPQLPATISREDGRVTVRAIRLMSPLRVDGNLDEELYRTISPISDFIQNEPSYNAPATERTEVWLSFDDDNIYISMRAAESQPGRMIVNEMRRDSFSLFQNENFQFVFDTFYDRRNAVSFQFNPLGGRMDGQVANESSFNADWNPVWSLQVRRQADGWTAEAAIPFKSLRYNAGSNQVWGFQARRINRWKNETSYLTSLPAGTGSAGHNRVSQYATLVGLEVPSGGRVLDVKPYLISDISTDLASTPQRRNDPGGDFGFDVKYSLTQNLTADFTYNTDFAQVEADEQQVNLTRFSLFFPEKREFFLENQGIFQFGGANTNNNSETPIMFYSRRIGLDRGQAVPLDAGGRVSGRVGAYTVGLMNIQTGDEEDFGIPSTNFTAARIRRDVLRRSTIGALYTRRSVALSGLGDAELFGVDGAFNFFENLSVNTFWARTATPGTGDDDTSYRAQINYNGDRYGYQAEQMGIGRDFDPQVGFMRRQDTHKSRAQLRFSPRPRNRFRAVRKFTYQTSIEYFTDSDDRFESRERRAEFTAEFQSSEQIELNLVEFRERLVQPFDIADGVVIPAGDYHYAYLEASFRVGQQRRASGTFGLEAGTFYGGTRTTVRFNSARIKVTPQLAFEPSVSLNLVDLPVGDFTAKVISTRTTYTLTPLMFVSGLVQYNSSNHSFGSNVRLRWEYQPGSELFVVYNDGRDTLRPGFPELQNRSFVVKINRLFRF